MKGWVDGVVGAGKGLEEVKKEPYGGWRGWIGGK